MSRLQRYYWFKAMAAEAHARAHDLESSAALDDPALTRAEQETAFNAQIQQRSEWSERAHEFRVLAAQS